MQGSPAVFLQLLGRDQIVPPTQPIKNSSFFTMMNKNTVHHLNTAAATNLTSNYSQIGVIQSRNISYTSQSDLAERKAHFFTIQLLSLISSNFVSTLSLTNNSNSSAIYNNNNNTVNSNTGIRETNPNFINILPFPPSVSPTNLSRQQASLFNSFPLLLHLSSPVMNCSYNSKGHLIIPHFETFSVATVTTGANFAQNLSNLSGNFCPLLSNSTQTSDETHSHTWSLVFTPAVSAVIAFFVLVCSILTFGGNLLVFIAFFIEKKLQITNNYFLLSLAVADGCVGLISVNFWLIQYLSNAYWPFGWGACVTWIFCDYVWCTTSIYHVFIISIDRYWSVSKPANYRSRMNPRMAFIMIIPTWLVSILWWLALIVGHPLVVGVLVNEGNCYANYWGIGLWTYLSTSITYWIPVIVITTLYIHIYTIAKKMKKKRRLKSEMIRKQLVTAAKATTAMQKLRKSQESSLATAVPTHLPIITSNPIQDDKIVPKSSDENDMQNCEPQIKLEPQNVLATLSRRIALESSFNRENVKSDICNLPKDSNKLSFPLNDSKKFNQLTNKESDNSSIVPESCIDQNESSEVLPKSIRFKTTTAFQGNNNTNNNNMSVNVNNNNNVVSSAENIESSSSSRGGVSKTENGAKLSNASLKKVESVIRVLKTPPAVRRLVKKQSNDKKAMRTLTFLLGAFILCWTPWNIAEVVNGIWGSETVNNHLYQFTWFLTYFNSALNPLCYAFANTLFKDTFIRILSCGKIKPKTSVAGLATNAAGFRAKRK
ncbi:muscarinic acetylcholine receptor M2-like [Convolutriloba macropyga]|uniref:muscarinic acetylcholine receptor M2-like n=1 Tax=Convolutriloba macropyga TaxID=536237 RepID=UPI003F527935